MKKLLLVVFTMAFCFCYAQNGTEPVKVTDMLKIKTVGNITINKDGTRAAFTVTSIEPDEKNKLDYKYITQIYTVPLTSSSTPVQLTFSSEGASQPAWSPDGTRLAFVRAVDGKPQIFILPTNGGEAFQLTKLSYGASNPKWSPDGSKVLFSTSITLRDLLKDSILNPSRAVPVWSLEKPGLTNREFIQASKSKSNPDGSLEEIRSYLLQNEIDGKARVINKLNFQDENNVNSDLSFSKFFIVDSKSGAAPKLLNAGFYRIGSADFFPDGTKLLLTGSTDSLQHPDRVQESAIYTINTDGTNLQMLMGKSSMNFSNAKISPSGKWVAYQYSPVATVTVPKLGVKEIGAGGRNLSFDVDRSFGNLTWSNDGNYIYFVTQSNGGAPLNKLAVTLGTAIIDQLSDLESGINSFDVAGDKILFSKTEVRNPSEIYLADAELKSVKQLSSFNDWVKTKKLSLPEKHSFKNEQGMDVEYWTMKPTNFQTGKKYPLLLEIHGGPSAMWGPGEASMWHEYQFFASKGYGIVYSNPRGSGGYGTDFLRANINDWGAGPSRDVLTALDKAVAEGWADQSKLLVTGGSYAGYLVAWIIGHDKRFAAACSQRGVYDLATFFGEGNAWRLVPNYFGGYPWEEKTRSILQRESPINYVQNITTPYIIFHGDNDRRTGFVQSEMLYRSLKALGRPVEYVRHPNATHEITRSGDNRQRMDQMLRTYEFFERWIKK